MPFFTFAKRGIVFDYYIIICDNIFIMENKYRHVEHSFKAIINDDSQILILGSVPSVMSIQNNFYYMHHRNRFWPLMEKIFEKELVCCSPEEKTAKLLTRKIALYDSVFECDIYLSSDSKITNVIPSDIPSLIYRTNIKKILCNGNVSYNVLIKNYPHLIPMAKKMPSTSPANAAFSFEKLVVAWGNEIKANWY